MNAHRLFPGVAAALALAVLTSATTLAAESDLVVISGFDDPESVVHDTMLDFYLVSNVGVLPSDGFPGALDHNGFISRVTPEGLIFDLKWRIQRD